MVLIILLAIAIYVVSYRLNKGENVYKFFITSVQNAYEKYAPYSFKEVRQKTKELGREYTAKQYAVQIAVIGGFAGVISYLYFYNILVTIIYVIVAIAFIPYLAYLRCQKFIVSIYLNKYKYILLT